ncbi:MAG: RloB domain-containing protein, partial [Kiritimatiellia bacterium]
MAKPIKISDRNKPWRRRGERSKRSRIEILPNRERFLIVCEGEKTEPNYFRAIQKELPQHVVEVEIHGEGDNTLSLLTRPQIALRTEIEAWDLEFGVGKGARTFLSVFVHG